MEDKNHHDAREPKVELGRIRNRPKWMRNLSVIVRAVHLFGAGVALGAFFLPVEPKSAITFINVAVISGGLLFIIEWMRHAELYREAAGWATIIKVLLVGAAYSAGAYGPGLAAAGFTVAAIGAHLPKTIRHRLLF